MEFLDLVEMIWRWICRIILPLCCSRVSTSQGERAWCLSLGPMSSCPPLTSAQAPWASLKALEPFCFKEKNPHLTDNFDCCFLRNKMETGSFIIIMTENPGMRLWTLGAGWTPDWKMVIWTNAPSSPWLGTLLPFGHRMPWMKAWFISGSPVSNFSLVGSSRIWGSKTLDLFHHSYFVSHSLPQFPHLQNKGIGLFDLESWFRIWILS